MSLYGSIMEKNGKFYYLVAAAKDSISLNVEIGKLVLDKTKYETFSEVSAKDYIKNKKYYGEVKRPLVIFSFIDKNQLDNFINDYNIVPEYLSKLPYYQKQMKLEDDLMIQQDINEIISMEEIISGKRTNKHTIGAIHNIDKYDPWDTMTEKEKAEQLLNNASDYNKLVEDGILTDEAMAPAIVNNSEHEKLPLLTYDTLPKELLEDFKSQGLHKFEIEKKIEEINTGIEKHNKMIDDGTIDDHITRVIGQLVDEDGSISGKIHINKENNNKKDIKDTTYVKASSMKEAIMGNNSLSEDDMKFLIKEKTIDGKYISNLEDYIFDNTSIDIYEIEEKESDITKDPVENNSFILENNIKDISTEYKKFYTNDVIEISEEDKIYISKLNIDQEDDIIGTNGIEWMSIHNDYFIFKPTKEVITIVTKNSVFSLVI